MGDGMRGKPPGGFWAALFIAYAAGLLRFALYLCRGSRSDAEDLLSETFLRVLTYCPDPSVMRRPLAFLKRVMLNIWIGWQRKEMRRNTVSLEDLNPTGTMRGARLPIELTVVPKQDQLLENTEFWRIFSKSAASLDPREKALLKMRLRGCNPREIAAEWNESIEKIRLDWARTVRKLRAKTHQARLSQERAD